MSTASAWQHQEICGRLYRLLAAWSEPVPAAVPLPAGSRSTRRLGRALISPGIVFGPNDAASPDVVWISAHREAEVLDPDGRLRATPDLVVEVLSPGPDNERRDRELKRPLYGRYGVHEYWIVDRQARAVEVYRPDGTDLRHVHTLAAEQRLTSPLLPGFTCRVAELFDP